MRTILKFWRRLHRVQRDFLGDCSALAAIEFAFIVPLMLVLFFGTIEFSSGFAASRKVTLTASALADLTSELANSGNVVPIVDSDLQNMFNAGISIMNPYLQNTVTAEISEIYVDTSQNATYQWCRQASLAVGANQATLVSTSCDPTMTLPAALKVPKTYVIYSKVSYTFVPYLPTIPFVTALMAPTGVNLYDVAYSRPRQATCLVYNGNQPPLTAQGGCPLP